MPDKQFLEEYPLFRKFPIELANAFHSVPHPSIKMNCPECKSEQTFLHETEYHYYEPGSAPGHRIAGKVLRAQHKCGHCMSYPRVFFVMIDLGLRWIMKVGQSPAWEIRGDPDVEKMLGKHADYFRKGQVCESQGYGIGAFGYYRRIVEETIDELLGEISTLMSGDERDRYKEALAKAEKTIVAHEKIQLVKDLLPEALRPDGMNPLTNLHSALSQGLHSESDDTCLNQAQIVRSVLVFMVHQIIANKAAKKAFTEGMRKLLDKKTPK